MGADLYQDHVVELETLHLLDLGHLDAGCEGELLIDDASQAQDVDCLQALGMAQMKAGLLDEAIATAITVTEMAPEDPTAFTSLSMAYMRKQMIEEAEKAQAQARLLSWKQELKENPNAPPPMPSPGQML